MNKPEDFEEWQLVTYIPNHANGDCNHPDCESGFVSSVNDTVVFVRFKGSTSQACDPKNLVAI